jgi:NCAIR mutase (PurE)-related protein
MAMDPDHLLELLHDVAAGRRTAEEAARALETLPFAEVSEAVAALGTARAGVGESCASDAGDARVHARVDHHRAVRTGFPEVIFCQGKTPQQVGSITAEILAHGDVLLATRAVPEQFAAVRAIAEDAVWHEAARLIVVDRRTTPPSEGHIVVATGGTADIPVAEEAATCAEVMGCRVTRLFDVGVAGIHRLLAHTDTLRSAHAIIAVAGMEGALPSLVAGLVDVPVIAVPTSVGYGANFGGVAALLTMLNSCAGGIGVVNIDNGFGAAVLAARINRPPARLRAADGEGPK